MLHPLSGNLDDLTLSQIEDKISDLTSKYFRTTNPQLQEQISTFIEIYKQEARMRVEQLKKQQNDDLDLDNLVKVN